MTAHPHHPGFRNAKGIALNGLGCLEDALAAAPNSLDGWHNRGLTLDDLGLPADAAVAYDHALGLSPGNPDIRLCAALSRLTLGDFERVWPDFTARHLRSRHAVARRHANIPDWNGGPMMDGSLLLSAEQGYGDTLQFSRFIPAAAARVDRLEVEAPEPLLRLLWHVPGVSLATARADETATAHCPLPDLLDALGLDAATAWAAKLAVTTGSRIGIAWRGRAETRPGQHLKRSLPLEHLLTRLPADATIFPLQTDITAIEIEHLASDPRVRNLTAGIADFADTAAIAAAMDLVVAIDTAPAHLALGLGCETWMLLPFSADWRWGIGADAAIWYPAARLFRQTTPGDWADPLDRLSAALALRFG